MHVSANAKGKTENPRLLREKTLPWNHTEMSSRSMV